MAHRNCAEANVLKCSKAEISNILGASQLESAQRSGEEETSSFGMGSRGFESYRKERPKLQRGGE